MAAPAPSMTEGDRASLLTPEAFADQMAAFGPFENFPHVAVGVSGGSDSMALCLLADGWARAQGGRVTALVVDHGLRAASSAEAAKVVAVLQDRGLNVCRLDWLGNKPKSRIQQAARDARYALMEQWCAANRVLHLMVAHHAGDQAETHIMRRARASGPDGLAAMSAVVEKSSVRILRPLLAHRKEDLQDVCRAFDQAWLEDPSNSNDAFERVRVRRTAPDIAHFQDQANLSAKQRLRREKAVSQLMATAVTVYPTGYAYVQATIFARADGEIAALAVGQISACIGSAAYRSNADKAARLLASLNEGQGGSLGGCVWRSASQGRYLVYRESRRALPRQKVSAGDIVDWDGRFRVQIASDLGEKAYLCAATSADYPQLPHAVRPSVPILVAESTGARLQAMTTRFRPKNTLSPKGFALANGLR